MNNNIEKLSKNIKFEGLDEFNNSLYKLLTSIYEIKNCSIVKTIPIEDNFNYDMTNGNILKISLEMKIPSYKNLKYYTSNKLNVDIFKNPEFKIAVVTASQQDTPNYYIMCSDKRVNFEIKKYLMKKIKEAK